MNEIQTEAFVFKDFGFFVAMNPEEAIGGRSCRLSEIRGEF
jgi:hypothetical protein